MLLAVVVMAVLAQPVALLATVHCGGHEAPVQRLKPGQGRDSAARVNRRVAVARNCGSIRTKVLDLEVRNASV
jgi:hypothetical protein